MDPQRQDHQQMDGKENLPEQQPSGHRLKTILLVDDDAEVRAITKWFLGSLGYILDSVPSAEEALVLFDPEIHDLVITDNRMTGMTGAEMAHIIKMRSAATPILMYTGMAPQDLSCVDAVILKPSHFLTLRNAISALVASPLPRTL